MSVILAGFRSRVDAALRGPLGVVANIVHIHYLALRILIHALVSLADLAFNLYQYPFLTAGLFVFELVLILLTFFKASDAVHFGEYIFSILTNALFLRGVYALKDDRIKEMEELIDRLMQENQKLHMDNAELMGKVDRLAQTLLDLQSTIRVPLPDLSIVVLGMVVIILLVLIAVAVRVFFSDARARLRSNTEYLPLRDIGAISREAYRPGSEEVEADPPKSLVLIQSVESISLGHGIIVKNPASVTEPLLLTATHVIEGKSKVFISRGGNVVTLDLVSKSFNLGTDVSMIPLTHAHLAVLGVTKKDLASLARQSVTCENVMVFCPPKATMGAVRPAKEFGLVTYSGTTRPGYSGTPYMVGKTVHAIHTGATSLTNVGVDAALIAARILRAYSPADKPEDTSDWLFEEVQKIVGTGKTPEWKHYGADIYEIKVGGRYYQTYEDDLRDMGVFKKNESYPAYNDTDSGNGQLGSAPVQGPGALAPSSAAPSPSASTTKPMMHRPLPQELTSVSTALLQSIVAQLERVSQPTAESSKPKRKPLKAKRAVLPGKTVTKPSIPRTDAVSLETTSEQLN